MLGEKRMRNNKQITWGQTYISRVLEDNKADDRLVACKLLKKTGDGKLISFLNGFDL